MLFGEYYNKGQKVLDKEGGLGQVWISGFDFAHNIGQLEKHGIYAVCSGVDIDCKYPEKFQSIKFNLDDCNTQDARWVFEPAYNFIEQQRKHTNVLVHCAAGISRCSLILSSYMMKKYKFPLKKCLDIIRKSRQCCQPNQGFMKQLAELETKLDIKS